MFSDLTGFENCYLQITRKTLDFKNFEWLSKSSSYTSILNPFSKNIMPLYGRIDILQCFKFLLFLSKDLRVIYLHICLIICYFYNYYKELSFRSTNNNTVKDWFLSLGTYFFSCIDLVFWPVSLFFSMKIFFQCFCYFPCMVFS